MTVVELERRSSTTPLAARERLLNEPVRLSRTGPADRLDRLDGRARDSWVDHVAALGDRPQGGTWLIDALQEANLTGHGGGHFPVARKWRSMIGTTALTVVANGSESECLSAKDAILLRQRPHLVLDGLHCAIETLRAQRGVVWLHEADRYTRRVVEDAIIERRAGGSYEVPVDVVPGPNTYLAGESSAIVRALKGGPALPTFRARRAAPGHAGDSTAVVHNVETLARIGLVARECGIPEAGSRLECFAAGPATSLLTVLSADARQLIEVPRTLSLREALSLTRWSGADAPSAVLLGGYGGLWARWHDVAGVQVNEPAMRLAGGTLGAGIVAPLTASACGVAETARIAAYLAQSSARQCGPCRHGLPALADSVEQLRVARAGRGELRRLSDDLETVRGRGACHHPDGATRLVASALETFSEDFAQHAKGRPCAFAQSSFIPVPDARVTPRESR